MRIAVDLDGVTWKFQEKFLKFYNKEYHENILPEDIRCWNYYPKERWENIYRKTTTPPYDFRIMDIDIPFYMNLLNQEHDIVILSHGRYALIPLVEALDSLGISKDSEYNEIIIDHCHFPKTEWKADVYIDDNPEMVSQMEKYPNQILLLFNHTWNLESFESKNVFRVYNWKEVMYFFKLYDKLTEKKIEE